MTLSYQHKCPPATRLWRRFPPPADVATGAWLDAMKQTRLLASSTSNPRGPLNAVPEPYNPSTGRYCCENILITHLVSLVCKVRGWNESKKSCHTQETDQLYFLYNSVNSEFKTKVGMSKFEAMKYRPGENERQDSKIVLASILFVKARLQSRPVVQLPPRTQSLPIKSEPNPEDQAGSSSILESTSNDGLLVAPDPSKRNMNSVSTPKTVLAQPSVLKFGSIVTNPDGSMPHIRHIIKRSADTQGTQDLKRPTQDQATTSEAILHSVKHGRITKSKSISALLSKDRIRFGNAPVVQPIPLTHPRPSPPAPPRPQPTKPEQHPPQNTTEYNLDFGNRIDQALLKIDKWIDAWLAGTFTTTKSGSDLYWDSFEFCLCVPDVLDADERREIKVEEEDEGA